MKPCKCSGTRWIAHLLRSTSGLVDKFGFYLQHFQNIIVNDIKNRDKATLEGKRRQLTDSKVLLLSAFFIDILDPAKIFSLASQKNDFNANRMVDRLDDMIFSYQLCKKAFAKNPETVFNLTHVDKVLMNIVCEQEKDKKIFKYQDIKIAYCEQEKASLANNGEAYIDMILEAIYERFGGLFEDDTDLEGTPIADDKFLCDICCILDCTKQILPGLFPPTVDKIELYFEKNLFSLERVLLRFEDIPRQTNSSINKFAVRNEHMSIINFCLEQLQVHLHAPYKLWQFLFPMKEIRDWCNIFMIIELCICTPCSNAELERFFSQMQVVKTDWCDHPSEVNLTCLLIIKVAGPSLKSFHHN